MRLHQRMDNRLTLAGDLSRIGRGIVVEFIVIAVVAPILAPYPVEGPSAIVAPKLQPPSLAHLMGTDESGQDVFSRVLWGAQTSLEVMAIGVVLALAIGFPVGLYSGYSCGAVESSLLLVMHSIYAFPGLLLALLVAVMVGKGVFNIGIAIT